MVSEYPRPTFRIPTQRLILNDYNFTLATILSPQGQPRSFKLELTDFKWGQAKEDQCFHQNIPFPPPCVFPACRKGGKILVVLENCRQDSSNRVWKVQLSSLICSECSHINCHVICGKNVLTLVKLSDNVTWRVLKSTPVNVILLWLH